MSNDILICHYVVAEVRKTEQLKPCKLSDLLKKRMQSSKSFTIYRSNKR